MIDIFMIIVCFVNEVYYEYLMKIKIDCCFEIEMKLRNATHHFEIQIKLENVDVFEARHDVTMM